MHTNSPKRPGGAVVVVDDDAAVLGALKFALELEGFSASAYRSGSELLAEAVLPEGACLVIDFNLPDTDGLRLLAALRNRAVQLPAVLITSNPSASVRRRAAAVDVPIVEKPLLGNALVDAIRTALSASG